MGNQTVGRQLMHALDASGDPVPVSVSDLGGGGTVDLNAEAPATYDAETQTIGVQLGTGANTAAAGNHTHSAGDLPTAEAVADVEEEDTDAAVASTLNALLASLRGAGYLAGGGD
ncbi:hypothetical protein [Nocardiopsis salina]|uniref:hypothetical protein n=1 Tax=Nocardiopsis salina TaxID=245836 RepID=UPI0003467C39|nr:hypothetical protein [Nocardiopsis salina]